MNVRRGAWLLAPLLSIAIGVATACSDDKGFVLQAGKPSPIASATASQPDSSSASGHQVPAALKRCATGRHELTSIADVLARISTLAPADGPCIVATLPRPLEVVASTSAQSAQPADGAQSPRIIFLLPKLNVAAVPSGPGSMVVELGEWVAENTRTIKGEIAVPVTAPLAADAAFTRVLSDAGGTRCGGCHRNEQADEITDKAFVSDAFRPSPDVEVSVADLSKLHDTCTHDDDPSDRCRMLHAVFDLGEVVQGVMSTDLGTFP